ncbi:DUF2807 domain-containing protein [Pedobacter polaris]|uniref:DUF2807 domain-containing protein n=1 Tax=Pedobacter polaris TaxID=2571273 RepID=A0A4V5P0B8_9SPHI|nr:head GIN domain-containing protein [Pedobacter polaris]TKC13182.1 DUF2807 domain-containing protein [Pedobacter polaris]
MKKLITVSFIAIICLTSCEKDRITADGNVISETRNPGTFTKIYTSGSNNVHVNYGNEYKVELKGSGNLIPYFKTNVVNGKLHLSYEHVNVKRNDIEIFVTMPTIKSVAISGSGTIGLNGNFPFIDFLSFEISGSGDIIAKSNMLVEEMDINISGSGKADAEKITCDYADVTISGSGDAKIRIKDKLKAFISGSGKVYYSGNATVESHISGSGKVIKL